METKANKYTLTIEHHRLETRYSHLRIRRPNAVEKLTTSMEQHGQLMPVTVIAAADNQWILIDGHLRMKALKRLGKDTIEAEVWPCDVTEALLIVLKNHNARALETFEEALFLQELHNTFNMSQSLLSERVGRDKSWISRRLSLLAFLPESVLTALSNGKISLWTATRVLTPLARANSLHAEQLLKYLLKNEHNTREMRSFYEHYQKSNHTERSKIINEPGLFFKAQRFLNIERQSATLKSGPEGKWQLQCRAINTLLSDLIALVPTVFYEKQTPEEYKNLFSESNRVNTKLNELTETIRRIRNAYTGIETNHNTTS